MGDYTPFLFVYYNDTIMHLLKVSCIEVQPNSLLWAEKPYLYVKPIEAPSTTVNT